MKITKKEANFLWEILNNTRFVAADIWGIDQDELMNKLAGEDAWVGSPVDEVQACLEALRDVYGPGLEDTDIWKGYMQNS